MSGVVRLPLWVRKGEASESRQAWGIWDTVWDIYVSSPYIVDFSERAARKKDFKIVSQLLPTATDKGTKSGFLYSILIYKPYIVHLTSPYLIRSPFSTFSHEAHTQAAMMVARLPSLCPVLAADDICMEHQNQADSMLFIALVAHLPFLAECVE